MIPVQIIQKKKKHYFISFENEQINVQNYDVDKFKRTDDYSINYEYEL